MPNQLSALLKQDFRWHVRKKDQINIESKLKVCRFIGEMTKFGVFSKVDTLFCIKQLLFDFSHHHIEMACALFESCGSFLYRSPDSHRRTKIYLEQMLRKKAAMSLDSRYTTMIENAYYSVAPPESSQVVTRKYLIKLEKIFSYILQVDRKVRPPLHQYIRKLLYTDLNKSNTEKILRQIRKLDWDNPDVTSYIVKCLRNVWNLKYFNIRYERLRPNIFEIEKTFFAAGTWPRCWRAWCSTTSGWRRTSLTLLWRTRGWAWRSTTPSTTRGGRPWSGSSGRCTTTGVINQYLLASLLLY